METTRKGVYPLHKFDIDENVNSEDSIIDTEKVLEVDSRLISLIVLFLSGRIQSPDSSSYQN